jgi:tetratricopeptide (TPR) repeat protein
MPVYSTEVFFGLTPLQHASPILHNEQLKVKGNLKFLHTSFYCKGEQMEQHQKHDAEYYNRSAFTKFFRKQYQGAIMDYSKALYLIGDDAAIYFSRALAHLEINQLNHARADFMKAKDLGFPIPDEFINRCK